jgi:nicotinamide mononucleotide adenylyltransferase
MKTAIFSGRFDPPHEGHRQTIEKLLKRYDWVIVVILDYRGRVISSIDAAKTAMGQLCASIPGPGIITITVNHVNFIDINRNEYQFFLNRIHAVPSDTVYVSGNPKCIENFKRMPGVMYEFIERSGKISGTKIRKKLYGTV